MIDDQKKSDIITNMFSSSSVFCLYGAAGTGKTMIIEHLSYLFSDSDILYLTNTHPALNNIKRRIKSGKGSYKTIASIINAKQNITCDILIIDECSMVGNSDMQKVLSYVSFNGLLLVGDIYQIEAITFGNWFSIAQSYLPNTAIGTLLKPYRSESERLLKLWSLVRENSEKIPEILAVGNYSTELNDTVFEQKCDDEIILCLNYDGLYGINNINHVLQSENKNVAVEWDMKVYKVGDPILFNDSNRYSPIIYNNMKGKIKRIEENVDYIVFDVLVWEPIHPFFAGGVGLEVVDSNDEETIIRFKVYSISKVNKDEDYDETTNSVPFQISYSVSIHKAQGLEYDSVKVIITNEIEERISHNIFYTAITRAKEHLKIYWSKGTQSKVLANMRLITDNKDYNLIKGKLDS
jgi:ATP-dependent exoDNAse (exonuclease V) alpha subunit